VDSFAFSFPYTASVSRYDRPSHRYCTFFSRNGWQVQFCEQDLRTTLPRTLTFKDAEKIRELARRGEALGTAEAREELENEIEVGRGGFYMDLTPWQYAQLRRP
jgi:hypothetical protein